MTFIGYAARVNFFFFNWALIKRKREGETEREKKKRKRGRRKERRGRKEGREGGRKGERKSRLPHLGSMHPSKGIILKEATTF